MPSLSRLILRVVNSSIFLFLFLTACATQTRIVEPQSRHEKKIEKILTDDNNGDRVEAPAEVVTKNVDVDIAPESAQEMDPRVPFFAVWIDSYGFDAYSALAFLQELEKSGHKPVKVVGSGLGCWVAQSWALTNSGNRAEWQASKWNDWQNIRSGFLGRITGTTQSRFEESILKLLGIRSWSQFQVTTDCPVIKNQSPYVLESGVKQNPETAFWISLQLALFGASDEQLARNGYFSGSLGGAPTSDELFELSRDLRNSSDKRFAGWIVLSTRPKLKMALKENLLRTTLPGRSMEWPSFLRSQISADPVANVKVISLSPAGEFTGEDLIKTENRRRFLLQGRKTAKSLLQQGEIRNFLGTP
jgi:hypothetical protein